MSRFVPVHAKTSLSDEYLAERWVNLDTLEDMLPLVSGGTRLVYQEDSTLDVMESPEELLKLQGL